MNITKNIKCKKTQITSRDDKYTIWNLKIKLHKEGLRADEIMQKRSLETWRCGNGNYSKYLEYRREKWMEHQWPCGTTLSVYDTWNWVPEIKKRKGQGRDKCQKKSLKK